VLGSRSVQAGVFRLTGLDARGWITLLPPLVLLVGCGLLALAGGRLRQGSFVNRPSRRAALRLALAASCGLGYFALCWALEFGDLRLMDPGTVGLLVVPAAIALLVLGQAAYLWLRGV
jgi:hypothetical protein